MGIYVQVAFRNILQARRRSLLLALALAVVSMLLVLLLSLSQGMSNSLLETTTTLASGHVNVHGFFKASQTSHAMPVIADERDVRPVIEAALPHAVQISSRGHGWGKVVSDTSSIMTSVTGIITAEETAFLERVSLAPESDYKEGGSEEIFGDPSRIGEPGTILLFAGQAKRLGVGVGDPVIIAAETEGGAMNSVDLTVVAIGRDLGMVTSFMTFTAKETLHELYRHKNEATGTLQVWLPDVAQTQEARNLLAAAMAERGLGVLDNVNQPFYMRIEALSTEPWSGQRFDVNTWEDEGAHGKWAIAGFDGISYFLVSVLILIIVIGIMNTMWMSVRERTPEIGTLRAIGMKRSRVLFLFVTEALLLGFGASVLGASAGGLLSWALDAANLVLPSDAAKAVLMSDTLHLSVGFEQVVRAVLIFTLVTGIASLIPASRASRMRPVTAMHHVG